MGTPRIKLPLYKYIIFPETTLIKLMVSIWLTNWEVLKHYKEWEYPSQAKVNLQNKEVLLYCACSTNFLNRIHTQFEHFYIASPFQMVEVETCNPHLFRHHKVEGRVITIWKDVQWSVIGRWNHDHNAFNNYRLMHMITSFSYDTTQASRYNSLVYCNSLGRFTERTVPSKKRQ